MTAATLMPPAPAATPTGITLAEFVAKHADDFVEVINGVVKELPMPGGNHGEFGVEMIRLFSNFVRENNLGRMVTLDTFVKIRDTPLTIRGVDFGFWATGRLPDGPLPTVIEIPPDLAVEVRSPSDRWTEVFTKVGDYLSAGVKVVVVFEPASRAATAIRENEPQEMFAGDDPFTLPDVLPGFTVPVSKFFG